MKGHILFRLLGAVQAGAALCVLGAIQFWAPVCDKVLVLQSGKVTNMKCFYAGRAGMALAVLLLVAAVVVLLSKKDHKKVQLVLITGAVLLFLVFTRLIGVCSGSAMEAMACETTEVWAKGGAAVILLAAVADLLSGREGRLPG